jgi:hypothetical protein
MALTVTTEPDEPPRRLDESGLKRIGDISTMRSIEELIDTDDPSIDVLRGWVRNAEVTCEILPPSAEREAVLFDAQVSTRSMLGGMAYETGGLLIDDGWLRILGSGHPRLSRTLSDWNAKRSHGFYLIGDDVAGGFFALNGGALGSNLKSVYYWAPDSLEWECLDLGLTDFVAAFLTKRIATFYEELRWPAWRDDIQNISGDRCVVFYPFLWTREGSLERSHRTTVSVREAFDLKLKIVRQLVDGSKS